MAFTGQPTNYYRDNIHQALLRSTAANMPTGSWEEPEDAPEPEDVTATEPAISAGMEPAFELTFKGLEGGPTPPDQLERALPTQVGNRGTYKPSTTADWETWRQRMYKFSGAKTPEEIAAVDDNIGALKQRRFNEKWGQAVMMHEMGRIQEAAQLYREAYDYVTNGQGVNVKADPQTGRMLVQPYHEASGVAGKPVSFDARQAKETQASISPRTFGRVGEEQRKQELHPLEMQYKGALTEQARAGAESSRATAARTRALTGPEVAYKGAQTENIYSQIEERETMLPARVEDLLGRTEYYQQLSEKTRQDIQRMDDVLARNEEMRTRVDDIRAQFESGDITEDEMYDQMLNTMAIASFREGGENLKELTQAAENLADMDDNPKYEFADPMTEKEQRNLRKEVAATFKDAAQEFGLSADSPSVIQKLFSGKNTTLNDNLIDTATTIGAFNRRLGFRPSAQTLKEALAILLGVQMPGGVKGEYKIFPFGKGPNGEKVTMYQPVKGGTGLVDSGSAEILTGSGVVYVPSSQMEHIFRLQALADAAREEAQAAIQEQKTDWFRPHEDLMP